MFNKKEWLQQDVAELENYLNNSKNTPEKIKWTANLLRTQKTVYALSATALASIAKEIVKGNWESFLQREVFSSHEATAIFGGVLNHIKNYEKFVSYLNVYLNNIDSWAHTDTLTFKNVQKNESDLLLLSTSLIKSQKTFERRMSLIILLKFASSSLAVNKAFETINSLGSEKEHYVNMAAAWLLCECFIKHNQETKKFFATHGTNKEIINKAIQKCRDSFRVSNEDKAFLLQFKM